VLERARVFRDASRAGAATQAEVFRGAILDALAHEFKTPLATIVTAAGALRETGGLRPEQLELAEAAETEASRLGRLTSRLLRIARLDKEEIKPQLETIDLLGLVTDLLNQYSKRWSDREFSVNKTVLPAEVSADHELIQLALRQLLDNASKYSTPRSVIKVEVESQNGFVTVRVWNSGSLITRADRGRIFERFYRGTQARDLAPGSGLGLYVARKIALAHGGKLELETETPAEAGAAFRMTLPQVRSESLIAPP
jgi:two-component system sensor histidine kinase KdpD